MAQGIYSKLMLAGTFPGIVGARLDADFAAASGKVPVNAVNISGLMALAIPTNGSSIAFAFTKTGNITGWTFSGGLTGYKQQVDVLVLPGAGGFTEAIPTSPTILWQNGTPPTPSTSSANYYWLISFDGFVTKYGFY